MPPDVKSCSGDGSSANDAVPVETKAAASATEGALGTKGRDIVVLGPPTADGAGVHVLRAREERLETGELRALTEGRPIVGEIVTLAPREDNPRICDVKESYAAPTPSKKGPAQIATKEYRANWDEIFGKVDRHDLN